MIEGAPSRFPFGEFPRTGALVQGRYLPLLRLSLRGSDQLSGNVAGFARSSCARHAGHGLDHPAAGRPDPGAVRCADDGDVQFNGRAAAPGPGITRPEGGAAASLTGPGVTGATGGSAATGWRGNPFHQPSNVKGR